MNVCVLGLGYVGLPTAALLATKGFAVLGVDIDARALETISSECARAGKRIMVFETTTIWSPKGRVI